MSKPTKRIIEFQTSFGERYKVVFMDIRELYRSSWITCLVKEDNVQILNVHFEDIDVRLDRDLMPFLEYIQRGGERPICHSRTQRMLTRMFDLSF